MALSSSTRTGRFRSFGPFGLTLVTCASADLLACGQILDVRPATGELPVADASDASDDADAGDAATAVFLHASAQRLDLGDVPVGPEEVSAALTVTFAAGVNATARLANGASPGLRVALESCTEDTKTRTCDVRIGYTAALAGPAAGSVIITASGEATQIAIAALGVTTLHVAFEGDGHGAVKSADGTVSCTETCDVRVAIPELALELEGDGQATPAGISGDCEGRERCSVKADGSKSVKVVFREPGVIALEAFPDHTTLGRMKPAPDGSFVISGSDFKTMFVRKVSATGKTLWHRTILVEGKTARLGATGLAVDDAGNGYVSNMYANDDYEGGQVVAKVGADGAFVWTKTMSPALDGVVQALAVHPTEGRVVSGGYESNAAMSVRLRWYDAAGELALERTTRGTRQGFVSNAANDVAIGRDGSLYACGTVTNSSSDFWLAKYDASATPSWSASFDGERHDNDFCSRLAIGADALVGVGAVDSTTSRGWVEKVDLDGRPLWNHAFGENDTSTRASGVAVAADGAVLVGAVATRSVAPKVRAFARLYGASGRLSWERDIVGADVTKAVEIVDVAAREGSLVVLATVDGATWLKTFFR